MSRTSTPEEEFWYTIPDHESFTAPQVDRNRIEAAIEELNKMKPRLAAVIRLYFYNSMSTDIIKAMLGVSRERVRQLIAEACMFLRTTLRRMAAKDAA